MGGQAWWDRGGSAGQQKDGRKPKEGYPWVPTEYVVVRSERGWLGQGSRGRGGVLYLCVDCGRRACAGAASGLRDLRKEGKMRGRGRHRARWDTACARSAGWDSALAEGDAAGTCF